MLLQRVFDNLAIEVDPFATCRVADGWRLRLPRRDWVTFHFILSGEGALVLGSGRRMALREGTLAVMPPGVEHAIEVGTPDHETGVDGQGDPHAPICELVAGEVDEVKLSIACGRVQVSYAGGIGLFDYLREAIVLDFSDSARMRGVFESLIEEYARSGVGSAAMMTALMNQCVIDVLRRVSEEAEGSLPWLSALEDTRLAKVIDTLLDDPGRPHTVESLAGVAGMSRATFVRHFEKAFERTPMDYVRDVRLQHAGRLLDAGELSIDQVAGKVGYASRSHFSRAFDARFGVPPAEFRRRHDG